MYSKLSSSLTQADEHSPLQPKPGCLDQCCCCAWVAWISFPALERHREATLTVAGVLGILGAVLNAFSVLGAFQLEPLYWNTYAEPQGTWYAGVSYVCYDNGGEVASLCYSREAVNCGLADHPRACTTCQRAEVGMIIPMCLGLIVFMNLTYASYNRLYGAETPSGKCLNAFAALFGGLALLYALIMYNLTCSNFSFRGTHRLGPGYYLMLAATVLKPVIGTLHLGLSVKGFPCSALEASEHGAAA
eukprot:CAMPEP_0178450454 /NCGR_PEP_ID=MMETSP0689_2-20121128/43134_1 /TAXON_ID=160604 /ORGANISM="Amphidinium massartii, Strain CS-259" /LENGTH=245 /DNA_ID=CAMNT_0020075923 /DNA_START=54 /DNA_END=791 /DNA_ORIENTATION=+